MRFKNSIPPDLLEIPNVRRLINVLDELDIEKEITMYELDTVVNPFQIRDRNFLKKFLFAIGELQKFAGAPYELIERLIVNAWSIYSLKCSPEGLRLFIKSALDGDVQTDFSEWYVAPYIKPSSFDNFAYLPDGEDLGQVTGSPQLPFTSERSPLYLFGGSFSDWYGTVKITIVSRYLKVEAMRDFIARLLPEFITMSHPQTTNILITYYDYDMSVIGTYEI